MSEEEDPGDPDQYDDTAFQLARQAFANAQEETDPQKRERAYLATAAASLLSIAETLRTRMLLEETDRLAEDIRVLTGLETSPGRVPINRSESPGMLSKPWLVRLLITLGLFVGFVVGYVITRGPT